MVLSHVVNKATSGHEAWNSHISTDDQTISRRQGRGVNHLLLEVSPLHCLYILQATLNVYD